MQHTKTGRAGVIVGFDLEDKPKIYIHFDDGKIELRWISAFSKQASSNDRNAADGSGACGVEASVVDASVVDASDGDARG